MKDTSLDYETEALTVRPSRLPVPDRHERGENLAASRTDMALRQMSEQAPKSPRMAEEPPKAPGRTQTTAAEALKLAHDAQKGRHAAERAKLWPDHQARRAAIYDAARAETRDHVATTKADNRSIWADHHRRQKAERWQYQQRERHLSGVVRNAIDAVTSRQIRGDGSDRGFLTMGFGYLASREARRLVFEERQRDEGAQLADALKTRLDNGMGQIKAARDRQLAESNATFTQDKAATLERQGGEVANVRAQWKAINAERERTAQAPKPKPAPEAFRVKVRIKDARRETRAAWSDEQTRRAATSADYAAMRERKAAAQQEPEAVKDSYDKAHDPRPPAPPVPNRLVMLSRPTPAPSPAGDVPPAKRAPSPVPEIDKAEAWAKRQAIRPTAAPPIKKDWTQTAPKEAHQKPAPAPDWTQKTAQPPPAKPVPTAVKDWTQAAAPPQASRPVTTDWTQSIARPVHRTDTPTPEQSDDQEHDIN